MILELPKWLRFEPAPPGATGCLQPARPEPAHRALVEDNPWHPARENETTGMT
jgi:hypothetical protein